MSKLRIYYSEWQSYARAEFVEGRVREWTYGYDDGERFVTIDGVTVDLHVPPPQKQGVRGNGNGAAS